MSLRLGSLFSGAGGLDLAIEDVFGAELRWVSDIIARDKHGRQIGDAPRILAHRFPGIPNLGDITTVDWAGVERVDIIAGGSPCQDVSTAGKRAGMTEGTRSNLWVAMRDAIAYLQPAYVIWENVRGALSARASSEEDSRVHELCLCGGTDRRRGVHPPGREGAACECPDCGGCVDASRCTLESDPRLLGDHQPGVPALRAAGRVLGDLATLGFDAAWCVLPAAAVGAPHGRKRIFVVAAHPERIHRIKWTGLREGEPGRFGWRRPRDVVGEAGPLSLLPTPDANMGNGGRTRSAEALARGQRQVNLNDLPRLLPTPTSRDHKGRNQTSGNGNGMGMPRGIAVQLLPTPSVADSQGGHERRGGTRGDELLLKGIATQQAWGPYRAAIARWETLTRPAPAPTVPGRNGRPRLNPQFSEWMMGWPAGWVTDVPGMRDTWKHHAIGNGVVPQQAAAAIRWCLHRLGPCIPGGAA